MKAPNPKFQIANTNGGQAALTLSLFFVFISLLMAGAFSGSAVAELKSARNLSSSKQSYIFAEGAVEDAIHRLLSGKNMPGQVVYTDGSLAATTTYSSVGNNATVDVSGVQINALRKVRSVLAAASGVSFNYGLQTGNGGFLMENTSRVSGNIYSNGAVKGHNSNLIAGDAVSAGSGGVADGIHATGTVYAHTIKNSEIDGDAHYQTIVNTIVGGTLYPASPDQPAIGLPISDEDVEKWKQAAENGGTINCADEYKITNDATLGPVKINCDLEISGDPLITIAGMIWVAGDVDIKNSAVIKLDSALGKKSIAVIADNPSNRLTSSKIIVQNSVQFQNSGTSGSYIMLLSQNQSAESGGNESAIDFKNTATGEVLLYAAHGEALMENNNMLREITAYEVHLKNSAHVVYETGLANLLFDSGPAGGYEIESWQEIQ